MAIVFPDVQSFALFVLLVSLASGAIGAHISSQVILTAVRAVQKTEE